MPEHIGRVADEPAHASLRFLVRLHLCGLGRLDRPAGPAAAGSAAARCFRASYSRSGLQLSVGAPPFVISSTSSSHCGLPQDRYPTLFDGHWVLLEPRIVVPAHTVPPRRRWVLTADRVAMNLWDAEPSLAPNAGSRTA